MGVFFSYDEEQVKLGELEFVLEREYLGENVGRFLLRGQTPLEFARHAFGDTLGNLNARLMQFPELGIVDAESLAAAIERLIDWKSLVLVASWPDTEGQLFDSEGQLVRFIPFFGPHAEEQEWHSRVDEILVNAGFVRTAPWADSGTRVVPL